MTAKLPLLALAAVLTLAAPAAAHKTYPSDDGQYLITLGQQGEPVYTYQKTGLDLIIRANTTARPEIPGVNATLNATLLGPGGEELPLPLQVQHGAVGRYTFTQAYMLTQPGLYQVRLSGTINNTPVSGAYDMPHEIRSMSDITFPDQGVAMQGELAAEIDELQSQIDLLQQQITALETSAGADDAEDDDADVNQAPVPAALTLLPLLAVVALAVRRR